MKNDKKDQSGIEIGIYTFGDIGPDPLTGHTVSTRQRISEIIEAAKCADDAGLDVFGIGEHHRLDYAVSSPVIILAAIAQVTQRIKLTSATTVLSTVDPVRLFEDFSTLDLLSNGRAEIIAGRGAYVESFPLFGYDLVNYDALFEENIELFLKLNEAESISWNGRFRSSLSNAEISPRPVQNKLPIWVGVGGTEESAARAGRLGVGMAIAILGGEASRFKPLVDLYRESAAKAEHAPEDLNVAVTGHAYIAKTTEQARDEFFPYYFNYWSYVNGQQGIQYNLSRRDFDQLTAPDTALFVGSPQQVAEKIICQHELFGHQRFIAQLDIGGLPFKKVVEGIELLAAEVAPIVRKATSPK